MTRRKLRRSGIFLAVFLLTLRAASPQSPGTLQVLHDFRGGAGDGAYPNGPLVVGSGGVLYGATSDGGTGNCSPVQGCGTIFSLTPPSSPGDSWTETVIYSFAGGSGDGAYPNGITVGSGGVLYGTTSYGGSGPCTVAPPGCGTVFSLTPPASPGGAWTEKVLYNFLGGPNDGEEPYASVVIGPNGVLYCTTQCGGEPGCASDLGCGTVFSLTPPAGGPGAPGEWTEAILHYFAGAPNDGGNPFAGVVIADGVLYGTTLGGGTGYGTVYSLAPASSGGAWTENLLHVFGGAYDGADPWAGVVIRRGAGGGLVLYGTTRSGGAASPRKGTVYSLTSPSAAGRSWTEAILYSFTSPPDGHAPIGGVILTAGGTLSGTTNAGGAASGGALFELTPPAEGSGGAWTETALYSFGEFGPAGIEPVAGLVLGPGGRLYGTTTYGSVGNFGAAFAWKP